MPSHVLDQPPYPATPVVLDVVVSITPGFLSQHYKSGLLLLSIFNDILSGKLLDRVQGFPNSFNKFSGLKLVRKRCRN